MWCSVFLHEFLDNNIRNFQALDGSPTPASQMLNLIATSSLRTHTVLITPGRGFMYSLADPLDEVIGISGRVRIQFPNQAVFVPVPVLQVGNSAEFSIQPIDTAPLSGTDPDDLIAPARALLRLGPPGTAATDLGQVGLPHRRFVNLRFDWHTSGQARLLQDGTLVGYQNVAAPTAQFTVARVGFGLSDASLVGTNPRYRIGRVFVRVLRRSDSLAGFSRLLPDVSIPDDALFGRCYQLAIADMLSIVDRLRTFMALVHQKLSQPWSEASGPPNGPFTLEATNAHRLATQAVVELGRMMRLGDFSAAETFLDPFEEFLRILHDALPDEFAALAAELTALTAMTELPQECVPVLEDLLEEHGEVFGPLLDVLSTASDRLRDITGVV